MARNNYSIPIVVTAKLIIIHLLMDAYSSILCPTYPFGFFGNGDISYSGIAISQDSQIIVGGSCNDMIICPGAASYPAPMIQKISPASLQYVWSVVFDRVNSGYNRVINLEFNRENSATMIVA